MKKVSNASDIPVRSQRLGPAPLTPSLSASAATAVVSTTNRNVEMRATTPPRLAVARACSMASEVYACRESGAGERKDMQSEEAGTNSCRNISASNGSPRGRDQRGLQDNQYVSMLSALRHGSAHCARRTWQQASSSSSCSTLRRLPWACSKLWTSTNS